MGGVVFSAWNQDFDFLRRVLIRLNSDHLFCSFVIIPQGPVVIVPTKYYSVPTDHFRDLGVSLVIWANHNMRASVSAMQQVTQQIYKDQSLVNVEKNVRDWVAV